MVTIRDVAKRAGVAPSTASRAMHNNKSISEETRKKVRQAMEELNYRPSFVAQNLANQSSNTVGVILPANEDKISENPFFIKILQGINSVCEQEDYIISIATSNEVTKLIANIDNLIMRGNVKKFIFLYSIPDDPVLEYIKKQTDIEYVVIGEASEQTACVNNDNFQASYDATKYLQTKGYKKSIFVCTDLCENVQSERFKGYCKCLQESNINPTVAIIDMKATDENILKQIKSVFIENPQIDSIVAYDDLLAVKFLNIIASMSEMRKMGIIGFNNSLFANICEPSLSSIELFPKELGLEAAKLVIQSQNRQVKIKHEIIERNSTLTLI